MEHGEQLSPKMGIKLMVKRRVPAKGSKKRKRPKDGEQAGEKEEQPMDEVTEWEDCCPWQMVKDFFDALPVPIAHQDRLGGEDKKRAKYNSADFTNWMTLCDRHGEARRLIVACVTGKGTKGGKKMITSHNVTPHLRGMPEMHQLEQLRLLVAGQTNTTKVVREAKMLKRRELLHSHIVKVMGESLWSQKVARRLRNPDYKREGKVVPGQPKSWHGQENMVRLMPALDRVYESLINGHYGTAKIAPNLGNCKGAVVLS